MVNMHGNRGKLIGLKRTPYHEETYDSDLEKYYMYELENMPGVKSWTKRHNVRIPYKILLFTRYYEPDFLVEFNDGSKEIHETKGLPFLFWLSTHLKKETAEKYCRRLGWRYLFITKDRIIFYKNNYLSSLRDNLKTKK
jgi:hypothetical protein